MTLTTTEELKHLASSDNTNELTRRLARECLANREAQPVAAGKFAGWGLYHAERDEFGSWLKAEPQSDCSDAITKHGYANVKLFTAPPAPAVPEEMKRDPDADVFDPGFMNGWNACRAAMLVSAPGDGDGA
ncbi:hypothetical protein OSC13_16780 [Serratia marcescens]|uniref:hypothetical protein n=1 Tax=Serratia marcescens TaxID=615 RepID=UPI002875762B|nr:hypothetical protein [Serratia marcescens]MDS0779562.1 hypothetical protein [Serratia marcescens]